jgi:polysaccharide biosynthesis/export protein
VWDSLGVSYARMKTLRFVLFISILAVTAAAQDRLPPLAPQTGANLPARPFGPNDLLSITVYGAPEFSRTVRVSTEGKIRLPMLPQAIEVNGTMPPQAEDRIAAALEAADVLIAPSVTVTVAEYYSRPVSVAGAVRRPLTFLIYEKITLLEALTRAEGLSADAGSEILVTQHGVTRRIPVKGLIDSADPDLNLPLEGGEEVRIPEVGRVFVVGNVHKPGAFRVENGSGMTVIKALALSEGLAPFAAKEAYIYRREDQNAAAAPKETVVELRRILDRKSPDMELTANDILYIPDNRRARATASAIEKAIAFAAGTASGALILGVNR